MSRIGNAQKFVREVQIETKKVIWPERKETIQSTLMVFVLVILIAIFLYGVDSLLSWLVQKVI
ncbi:MAG: preprotein translocase subunit SecE [Zetaproteobacteria bacterium]|nr:MAG: preprotein translocase subunit SecE [Zetaproteobacteria bacterium]